MTDDDKPFEFLYQLVPGETIASSREFTLEPGQATEPVTTEAAYDLICPIDGTGTATWDDETVPLGPGMTCAVPTEATYTITAATDTTLSIMVIGIGESPYLTAPPID